MAQVVSRGQSLRAFGQLTRLCVCQGLEKTRVGSGCSSPCQCRAGLRRQLLDASTQLLCFMLNFMCVLCAGNFASHTFSYFCCSHQ